MQALYKDLTEDQKALFTEVFYEISPYDDRDSPMPWGCPWLWVPNGQIDTTRIEAEAQNFFNMHEDKIREVMEDEEEFYCPKCTEGFCKYCYEMVVSTHDV